MSDVYEIAKNLGEEILKLPEAVSMLEVKKLFDADPKAKELLEEFNAVQQNYQMQLQNPELTKEEYESLTENIQAKSDYIKEYETTKKLIESEENFNKLMNSVFTVVTDIISGETNDGGGCGGGCDCSSGGGCGSSDCNC